MLFRLLFFLLATGVVGYIAICALLYVRQERLIFFPSIVAAEELEAFARAEDFVPWTNARGERIGWQSPAQPGAPALLICHGNAGHALGRNYSALRQRGAFRIFLLEYPGYGARPGPPSARALVDAAIEAIDTLVAEEPGRSIYLFGQSLGSGVVSLAAARRPDVVAGVVLLTPFDSLAGAAARHYPWLPVDLLMRHRLDSDRHLPDYGGPVAFLIAGQDDTTPAALGQRLFELYPGPKRIWIAPAAGHNDFDALLADWPAVQSWLRAF